MPATDFAPATARLSDITGNVEITTTNQYSPADPDVPLNIGDSVIVFEDSGAFLTFGPTCSRQLPEQSSLVVRVIEGCAVADLVETQTQTANGTANGMSNGDAFLVGTFVALGIGTYLIGQDGDDDEPVTPD